ncbi:MAG: adenylosuccinate lyase family protein [Pararhodobacter sp.]|nr:adenylosuccinate lyase family protein [Pararhodobacter sp.]
MTTVLASPYFRDQFCTPAMRAVFADEARIGAWLQAEVALARAQAGLGLIPPEAADEIARVARVDALDLAAMKAEYDLSGVAIIPLVRHLGALCSDEARRWVHWGATTQDILDTGFTLQIRDALALMANDLDTAIRALAVLAARHRDTVMAGRSFQQQAVPITFGYKSAVWLDELLRHRARLPALRDRVLVGQLGGAVGTLATLGDDGMAVRAAMMQSLGLGEALITWHTARDRWAELVHWLAMVGATLGKIGTEIALLMRSEVAELREPLIKGRGGSSTMPQKRNPVACPQIIALARRLRDLPGGQLDAMVQEHERGTGAMPVEWAVVPDAFLLLSGAFCHALPLLQKLEVDATQMRANLDAGGGLLMSEAVMMGLAPHIGRGAAHERVTAAARKAQVTGGTLRKALLEDAAITAHLTPEALDHLLDPGNYTGSAGSMVDDVLELARAEGLA